MKKIYGLLTIALLFSFSVKMSAQTAGTMSFVFTNINPGAGWYNTANANKYHLAVWIESCTTCGAGTTVGTSTFVRTKIRYAQAEVDHLPTWAGKCGCASTTNCLGSACNITNATTGATQTTFGARTITWDGTNAAGTTLLADGNYRVCVQETWGHGTSTVTRYFPFVKGTTAYTNTTDVTTDTRFSGITLTWTPQAAATETFAQEPSFVVYPNPTKGYVNVEFKTDVKSIKVIDVLGKEIFNEEIIEATTDTTKKIDLSNFTNGVYIVMVSDSNGKSSTQRIVLDK